MPPLTILDRQDLLYTLRSSRRTPLLSAFAVLALSLGIGLNAGVFTILNSFFLNSPTSVDPASFVQLYPKYEGWFTGAGQYSAFTTEDYEALQTRAHTLDDIAAWQLSSAVLEQEHRRIGTTLISCNYFHVLGIDRPAQGRFFGPNDCARGTTQQIAILSEPFWKSQYSADPGIVGKTIHLANLPFVVLGIAPPDAANFLQGSVFVPYTLQPLLERSSNLLHSPDSPWLSIAGRLHPGYSRADARSELETILHQQDRAYLDRQISAFNRKTSLVLTNGSFIQNPAVRDRVVALIVLILGPLSLVLLLACSNVTMLFLSRTIARRGEVAVRLALGVGRARLLRMLLFESSATALAAGIVSVFLAYRVPMLIMNAIDPSQSRAVPLMHPDWRVFAYTTALIVIATIASSLAPMHAAWKLDLVSALKGRESAATSRSQTTNLLIVSQIAMSFVLITAAVLFERVPSMVTGMDPGFDTRHTLQVPLEIDTSDAKRPADLAFDRALEARLLALPGVQSLAYESIPPFRQTPPSEIRLATEKKGDGHPVSVDNVSTGFFSTFAIRLIAGRTFQTSDTDSSGSGAPVAIVSQAFAKQFWPDQNPLGQTIVTPEDRKLTVIGIVADTRSERFGVLDGPRLYTLRDITALDGQLYVRFTGNATVFENAAKSIVRSLDPTQTGTPQTIWESLEADAESLRSLARIILVMASIALLMAIAGVYGVLSFAVSRRTREFGIRMVLGANRTTVFAFVLQRGMRQIAIGLLCGVALAQPGLWGLSRMLQRSNLPLQSFDPTVYGLAALVLAAVSIAAMVLPALRATHVDPLKTLRSD